MNPLPKSLDALITEFGHLPGVGPRTAERYAFNILKQNPAIAKSLAKALTNLHDSVDYCSVTYLLVEKGQDISPLYSDPGRNKQVIMVIEQPLDVLPIEKTRFDGTYHVLGGALSPIDGIGPDDLRIKELIARIKSDEVTEVIIATNANVEGESTALLLQKQLADIDVTITRLARGLPAGVDLEYADQITLTKALEGRHEL